MSFLDRLRTAPVEPSAAERAADACAACRGPGPLHLLDIGGGYGKQKVCEDPKACRLRATAAGIWKRYPIHVEAS